MMDGESKSYEALPALSAVYLEDSYVLGLTADEHSVQFDIDLVLTSAHPSYHEPRRGEQYCFRRSTISVDGARAVRWIRLTIRAFRDATGEVDYGSIDSWRLVGDTSHIEGDWGELQLQGGVVRVLIKPDENDTGSGADDSGEDGNATT